MPPKFKSPHVIVIALALLVLSACHAHTMPRVAATAAKIPHPLARPLVIAHRGASALRPEHTLEAYVLAIEHGADLIEPDLVMSKDGVLVARHENALSDTTDVASRPEFASRRTVKTIDGRQVEDWFSEDFTLAELKTLRMRERIPQLRSTEYDGRLPIATFEEIIELAARESARRGRLIGLAPEIKHPTHFRQIGLAMEQPLLDALAAHPYTRHAPVLLQSFETTNLRELRRSIPRDGNIRLLQLTGGPTDRPYDLVAQGTPRTYLELVSGNGLAEIAAYADAIGPHYRTLQLRQQDGRWHSDLLEAAHAAGLQVIVYTFRPENHFIDTPWQDASQPTARNPDGAIAEMRAYLDAGIDGFFADDPALGRRAADGL